MLFICRSNTNWIFLFRAWDAGRPKTEEAAVRRVAERNALRCSLLRSEARKKQQPKVGQLYSTFITVVLKVLDNCQIFWSVFFNQKVSLLGTYFCGSFGYRLCFVYILKFANNAIIFINLSFYMNTSKKSTWNDPGETEKYYMKLKH